MTSRTVVRDNEGMLTLGKVASDLVASPAELSILEETSSLRAQVEAAEARILALAVEWAELHPAEESGDEAFPSEELPTVDYRCTASFALNAGMSDSAGTHLIHQALQLKHRLPGTWARLHAGGVQAWRARRVAERTIHQPADIAAVIDGQVAPIAHKIGPVTLDRLITEAKLRLRPAESEAAQLAYLDRRHVKLFDVLSADGVATIEIRADLKDAYDFDRTVSEIATILGKLGNTESFDVRRSLAIGILADPQAAADLLSGDADATTRASGRKHIQVFVHLTPDHFTGANPVARFEHNGGHPILERQVREWCGRSDTHLKITPVIDLVDQIAVGQYEVPRPAQTTGPPPRPDLRLPALHSASASVRPRSHPPLRQWGAHRQRQRCCALPQTPPGQDSRRLALSTLGSPQLSLDQPIRSPLPPRPPRNHRNHPPRRQTVPRWLAEATHRGAYWG